MVVDSFTLKKAIKVAKEAHSGQVDKAGKPYIEHPIAVMEQLQTEEEKITGILHDVVEDSDLKFKDLEKLGCPARVIAALKLITHSKNFQGTEEAYWSNIKALAESGNQIAINVKFADLTHNSNLVRLPNPSEKDLARVAKYRKCMDFLKPLVSDYLNKNEK